MISIIAEELGAAHALNAIALASKMNQATYFIFFPFRFGIPEIGRLGFTRLT
jgi:hypothetical protein